MSDPSSSAAMAWHVPTCIYPRGKSPDTVPGPRAAHSCNLIGNRMFVFGGWNGKVGLNDLYVLDTTTMEWSTPITSGMTPSTRNNHATFVHQGRLYIHGGHDHTLGWLSDMHVLDTNPANPVGDARGAAGGSADGPPGRPGAPGSPGLGATRGALFGLSEGESEGGSGSTGEGRGDCSSQPIPQFGGFGSGAGSAGSDGAPGGTVGTGGTPAGGPAAGGGEAGDGDSSWHASGSTGGAGFGSWPDPSSAGSTGALPRLRSGSGSGGAGWPAAGYGNSGNRGHGGGGGGPGGPSSSSSSSTASSGTMVWSQPQMAGTAPSARACHTLTLIGRKVFCLGGYDGMRCFSDVDVLDLDTQSWVQPRTHGQIPKPRNAQTVTAVGPKLYLFGGHSGNTHLRDLHVLDTETLTWSQPEVRGSLPPGLRGHTANLVGHKIVLFGGFDGRGRSNDLYVLDTNTCTWEHPATGPDTPAGRQRHTACLVGGRALLVLGGFNGGQWMSDLHSLDVSKVLYGMAARGVTASSQDALATCMRGLVNNPSSFPDVVFLVEGRPVYGHRAVLAARCPHYRIMFSGPFREATTTPTAVVQAGGAAGNSVTVGGELGQQDGSSPDGQSALGGGQAHTIVPLPGPVASPIVVADWSHAAFVAAMEFLYTGTVQDLQPDTALDALGLADALGLDALRGLADHVLQHALDSANVCTVLAAAHRYGAVELKSLCMDFLLKHSEEVDLRPLEGVGGLLVEITRLLLKAAKGRG